MSWIQTIADGIEKAFDTVRPALKSIPPFYSYVNYIKDLVYQQSPSQVR